MKYFDLPEDIVLRVELALKSVVKYYESESISVAIIQGSLDRSGYKVSFDEASEIFNFLKENNYIDPKNLAA